MLHRSRKEVNELFAKHSFLPLFTPDDMETARQVVKAAYDGGVRLFECTNRSAAALSVFKELVPFVMETMPDLLLGAGTIMNKTQAQEWYDAGAQFIVSPVIPADVAIFCEHNSIFWCPGASTLNEIVHAQGLGADMVKIFPANYLGGPGFVKAIMGPCPTIRIMPTGGVDGTEQNLREWFEAGVVSVGMGSQLFKKEILAGRHYDKITSRCQAITASIQLIKSELKR